MIGRRRSSDLWPAGAGGSSGSLPVDLFIRQFRGSAGNTRWPPANPAMGRTSTGDASIKQPGGSGVKLGARHFRGNPNFGSPGAHCGRCPGSAGHRQDPAPRRYPIPFFNERVLLLPCRYFCLVLVLAARRRMAPGFVISRPANARARSSIRGEVFSRTDLSHRSSPFRTI